MALINCSECGQQVSDKASYCPNCGNPINQARPTVKRPPLKPLNQATPPQAPIPPTPPTTPPQTKHAKSGNSGMIIAIVAAAIALVGIGIGSWFIFSNNEEKIEITAEFTEKVHRYDDFKEFSEGLAAVSEGVYWGYINTKGDEVIQCKFLNAFSFSEGLAVAMDSDGKYGYIDTKGNWIIEPQYIAASEFVNGIACVIKDSSFDSGLESSYDLCNKKMNFINKKGEEITDISGKYTTKSIGMGNFDQEYAHITCFNQELDAWEVKDSYENTLYIGRNGKVLSEKPEAKSKPESDYIIYEEDGKYGVKDKDGHIIAKAKYSDIMCTTPYPSTTPDFRNGLVVASIADCMPESDECAIWTCYIDLKGNDTFTEEDYKEIEEFKEKVKSVEEEIERMAQNSSQYDTPSRITSISNKNWSMINVVKMNSDAAYYDFKNDHPYWSEVTCSEGRLGDDIISMKFVFTGNYGNRRMVGRFHNYTFDIDRDFNAQELNGVIYVQLGHGKSTSYAILYDNGYGRLEGTWGNECKDIWFVQDSYAAEEESPE